MPFYQDDTGILPGFAQREPPEPRDPSLLSVAAAAARTESVMGSVDVAGRLHALVAGYDYEPEYQKQPGYDALDDGLIGTEYEEFIEAFDKSTSPEETARIKSKIDQRINDRRVLQDGGIMGIAAQVFFGGTDLTMLPFIAVPGGGATRVAAGVRTALLAGGEAAAQESVLHALDPTRTTEESAYAIGGSTVLGGLLGSLFGKAPDELKRLVDEDVNDIRMDAGAAFSGSDELGLQRAATMTDDLEMEGLKTTGFNYLTQMTSPAYRTLASPAIESRQVTQQLVYPPARLRKAAYGYAREESVEELTAKWNTAGIAIDRQAARYYPMYRKRIRKEGGRPIDRTMFEERVHVASFTGRADEIAEINDEAALLRRAYDTFKERATAVGQPGFHDEMTPKGQKHYAPSKFNTFDIMRRATQFAEDMQTLFMRHNGMDEKEARLAADQLTNEVRNTPEDLLYITFRPDDETGKAAANLRLRTLDFPRDDPLMLKWTVNDARLLFKNYMHTVPAHIEMTGKFGDARMGEQIEAINRRYKKLREEAVEKAEKAGKKYPEGRITRLDRLQRRDLRNIEAMRDRVLGNYGRAPDPTNWMVRAGRSLRLQNYLTMSGNFGISSAQELAKVLGDHGIFRGLRTVAIQIDKEAREMTARDARRVVNGLQLLVNSRAKNLYDYDTRATSRIGKAAMNVADVATVASGLEHITYATRLVASGASMDKLAKTITRANKTGLKRVLDSEGKPTGVKVSAQQEYLADMGIPENYVADMARELDKHHKTYYGQVLPMLDDWDNQELADVFEAAIRREVLRSAPERSVGLTPNVIDKEFGKFFLQFKRFFLLALPNNLLTAISRRDADAITGMMMSVYASYWIMVLKLKLAGKEPPEDLDQKIVNSIDQSGALGHLTEFWNMSDAFENPFGPSALLGEPVPRYAKDIRNVYGTFGGPSVSTVENAFSTLQGASNVIQGDEASDAQVRRATRLIWFQNYLGFRQALDEVADR